MNIGRPQQRYAAILLALGLFAIAYGTLFAYPRQLTRGFLINDEAWYAEPSRNLLEGRGYVTDTLYPIFALETEALPVPERFKQVGFSWLGAVAGSIFGMTDRVLVLVALMGMGVAVPACFAALRQFLHDDRLALLLTMVSMGTPVALVAWTAAVPESWFCFLFWSGLAFLQSRSSRAVGAAGALLVAAVYFKGYAILYLPIGLMYLFVRGHDLRKRLPAYVGGMVVAAVLAQLILPAAANQLSESGASYAGSMMLFETSAFPIHEGPFYSLAQVDALSWIFQNPADYLLKVARMIGRTKAILEALGGPAAGMVLLPLLLLSVALSSWRLACAAPGLRTAWLSSSAGRDSFQLEDAGRRFLLLALIGVNFAFFWGTNFKSRYFLHLLPLMLALAVIELKPFFAGGRLKVATRRLAATVLVLFFAAYPLVKGLERSYRDPHAYLGRFLAVRFIDYATVVQNLEQHVPAGAVVMSPLAHEITWYTRRPTLFPPADVTEMTYLVDKFDVSAVYLHPGVPAPPEWNNGDFRLADGTRGLLWLGITRWSVVA